VLRGFGFVHHSRTIIYRAVPNPNITIRDFFSSPCVFRARGSCRHTYHSNPFFYYFFTIISYCDAAAAAAAAAAATWVVACGTRTTRLLAQRHLQKERQRERGGRPLEAGWQVERRHGDATSCESS
jgi:hypothetical protein